MYVRTYIRTDVLSERRFIHPADTVSGNLEWNSCMQWMEIYGLSARSIPSNLVAKPMHKTETLASDSSSFLVADAKEQGSSFASKLSENSLASFEWLLHVCLPDRQSTSAECSLGLILSFFSPALTAYKISYMFDHRAGGGTYVRTYIAGVVAGSWF